MKNFVTSSLHHTRLCILLACLLLGVYLLVYVNVPDSADGNAMLAVAAGFMRYGSPDMNPVAASEAFLPLVHSRLGSIGVDGALYSKKGLTPSLLLLPLVAASEVLPWLTTRATAMFFNPLITVTTALALYTFAVWLGFRARTAFVTAMIYGLCTFAFVYTKTLFGEPLAGLLLLLALMAVYRYRQCSTPKSLAWAGLLLGLLVGVNTVYVVVLGMFGVYVLLKVLRDLPATTQVLAPRPRKRGERTGVKDIETAKFIPALAFSSSAFAVLAALALFNWARFGSPAVTGYGVSADQGFTYPFLLGMYGQFFSPYRGLFWYNPILLLSLPGGWLLRHQSRLLAGSLILLTLLQGAMFASWWSWHGGVTWGARFLVPAVPLLALGLLPVIERAWRSRPLFFIVYLFAVISFGIQLLGALYSYAPYMNYLNAAVWRSDFSGLAVGDVGAVLNNLELSPIVGHLILSMSGWQFEPSWLANGIDTLYLLAAVGLMGVGIFLAFGSGKLLPDRLRIITALISIVIALNIVGARQTTSADVTRIQAIQREIQPADTLYVMSSEFGAGLLDIEGRTRVIAVNAPTEPEDALWDYALDHSEDLVLLTWLPPTDPLNWQERELWETSAFVGESPVEGLRAVYFDRSPEQAEDWADAWYFGEIAMLAHAVQPVSNAVSVVVRWSAQSAPAQNYSWFIHLLKPDGEIAAQQDRQPLGGYAPTTTWTAGAVVTDRLLFPVQVNDLSGWKLRVGFINPATGERLPVTTSDGEEITLGYVEITL